MYRQSGFLIQSTFGGGDHKNFEVIVPNPDGGMTHYWRDNEHGAQWKRGGDFGAGRGLVESVSFIEGDYQTDDNSGHYNFELVALRNGSLEHWARENADPFRWFGPTPITDALFVAGGVSLVMGGYKYRDNNGDVMHDDLYVASGSTFRQLGLWKRKDDPFGQDGGRVWTPAEIVDQLGMTTGTSMIVSRYASGDVDPNSFDTYEIQHLIAACRDDELVIFRSEGHFIGAQVPPQPPFRWKPYGVGRGYRGKPSLIQSRFGLREPVFGAPHYGNYELVAPMLAGGIAHFWRDNGDTRHVTLYDDLSVWAEPHAFAQEYVYDEVSLIQSDYSLHGNNFDFELVARRRGMRGFDFWWREDASPFRWFGPEHVE